MATDQTKVQPLSPRNIVTNKDGYFITFTSGKEGYRTYVCADIRAFRYLIYKKTGRVLESYDSIERISTSEVSPDLKETETAIADRVSRREYRIPGCLIAYGVHILSSVPSIESR